MSVQTISLNDDNFQTTILSGVTLVDFYSKWCGPCRMMEPAIDELSIEMDGKAKIGKLDIEVAPNTASQLNVTMSPTIILFKDGKEIERVIGLRDFDALKEFVSKAI